MASDVIYEQPPVQMEGSHTHTSANENTWHCASSEYETTFNSVMGRDVVCSPTVGQNHLGTLRVADGHSCCPSFLIRGQMANLKLSVVHFKQFLSESFSNILMALNEVKNILSGQGETK